MINHETGWTEKEVRLSNKMETNSVRFFAAPLSLCVLHAKIRPKQA